MLSPEKAKVVEGTGKFIVQACPGSGKTFTVAHRLAHRLTSWSQPRAGIATLSFTNVAHEEISRQLQELGLPAIPSYPHFLGTIDSFINTWIFLPYGHLLMQCGRRPRLVGSDRNPWQPTGQSWSWRKRECNMNRCQLEHFTFDVNGNLANLQHQPTNCPVGILPCQVLKQRFVREGYATQADANYWAMRILETYPQVARVLAMRFPEVVVDEAQDTSEIQMRILDLLSQNGLTEVVLVGDPDQAIYEWRDARPEAFVQKASAEGWGEPVRLLENWRSSQRICDATVGFARYLSQPATALGADASCDICPRIIEYDPGSFQSLPSEMGTLCHQWGIQLGPERVAILVRTRRILRKILGKHTEADVWNDEVTRLLANAAFFSGTVDCAHALDLACAAAALLCFGEKVYLGFELDRIIEDTVGKRRWRVGIWQLLSQLPPADLKLSEWVSQATQILHNWLEQQDWPICGTSDLRLKVKQWVGRDRDRTFLDWPVSSLFAGPSLQREDMTVETIHAAKGKTYEAVLSVVSDKGSRRGTARQLGERPDGDEELRIAYVAMTRPRKLLVVAVPRGTDMTHLHRFPAWMRATLSPSQLPLL